MSRFPPSSPERRPLPAFLLAGALLLGLAPALAQPQGDVQAKALEVLKDPRFQRELPKHAARRNLDAPEAPADVPIPPSVAVPALEAGAAVGQVAFVVLLVVILVLLGVWISNLAVQRRRRAIPRGDGEKETAGEAPQSVPAFDEATRLAAEGRYAEAVHALLLAAIRHFAERSRVAVQPSRTSRELVRLLPIGPDAREAFAELVRMVELSLFGGAAVGREDYERSLARFQALTRRPV